MTYFIERLTLQPSLEPFESVFQLSDPEIQNIAMFSC